ncbi:hypothetical protein ACFQUU_08535 [Herbaspirillum sp. GCM10030257]|uniref:hypothetical protein n=1 Tax=Herbaspirillum sp. GCM10030257 TaxID=3273393 RepID=UPI00360BEC8F
MNETTLDALKDVDRLFEMANQTPMKTNAKALISVYELDAIASRLRLALQAIASHATAPTQECHDCRVTPEGKHEAHCPETAARNLDAINDPDDDTAFCKWREDHNIDLGDKWVAWAGWCAGRASMVAPSAQPVDLILHCPNCGLQHVDEPDERTPGWQNPAHRSHLCHGCKHIWRPADVATNGVRIINTKGKNDCEATLQAEPALPKLPQSLLNLIGEYGMARTDGVNQLEIQHRWLSLIDGIKGYARNVAATPDSAAPAEGKV